MSIRIPASEKSPIFASKQLKEAVNRSRAAMLSYRAHIEAISADIITLEEYLRDTGIPHAHQFCLKGLSCFGKEASCILSFERDTQNKFRFHYRVVTGREPKTPFEAIAAHMNKEISKKPLIEAPVQVRLEIFKYLPNFLDTYTQSLMRIRGEEHTASDNYPPDSLAALGNPISGTKVVVSVEHPEKSN